MGLMGGGGGKVETKPYDPYGLGTAGPVGKSKYGADTELRDWAASGVESMWSPYQTGLNYAQQSTLGRESAGLARLSFLDAINKLGTLNQTVGVNPMAADSLLKNEAVGLANGVAANAKFKRDQYLAAVQALLKGTASQAPMQKTKTSGPNQNLMAGLQLGQAAGQAMMTYA